MRITHSMPLHIARAYGMKPAAAPSLPAPTAPVQNKPAQSLVAGAVAQPVNFDAQIAAARSAPSASGVFQLYTRAADKIEAAVAVQLGRTLDMRG